MRVEVLTDPGMALRGARMLSAMVKASPLECIVRERYVGDCDILMVYGTGHPVRRPWWDRHRQSGRRCIGWDLGYWRQQPDAMRCTIDEDHPWRMIRPEDGARWSAAGLELREEASESGPILLIGVTAKACRAHGLGYMQWEASRLRQIRRQYPGRAIHYRPKRETDGKIAGLPLARGSIEEALRGASLVVCRHSNVAVDACMAGVPVVCEDGAARALYTGNIASPTMPTREQRLGFLQSLAHWQYTPSEASEAWKFLLDRIKSA